jgi:hypothetical protein
VQGVHAPVKNSFPAINFIVKTSRPKIAIRRNRDSLQRKVESMQLSGIAANRRLEYTYFVDRGSIVGKILNYWRVFCGSDRAAKQNKYISTFPLAAENLSFEE